MGDQQDSVPTTQSVALLLKAIGRGGDGSTPAPRAVPVEPQDLRVTRLVDSIKQGWSTVPEDFRWARFGPQLAKRVSPSNVIVRAQDVAGQSMLLRGATGVGKTSLAVACLRRVIDRARQAIETGDRQIYELGARVMFVTAYDLAKAGVYSPLGCCPEKVQRALEASLLVIDDLSMDVEVYRQSATAVREVIHERHAQQRPTIVTTYLRTSDISDQYGAGIARRLTQDGHAITLGEST